MPLAPHVEPFYRTLGERIAQRRAHKRFSQDDLGKLLDPPMSRASIAQIEMGRQRVLAHTLAQLAHHLSVPVAWFYEGSTEHTSLNTEPTDTIQILEEDLKEAMQDLSSQQAQRLAAHMWQAAQP
jgi:transcriptional regulator with XRE-family HTH domain